MKIHKIHVQNMSHVNDHRGLTWLLTRLNLFSPNTTRLYKLGNQLFIISFQFVDVGSYVSNWQNLQLSPLDKGIISTHIHEFYHMD
jgi:hypothetical protein